MDKLSVIDDNLKTLYKTLGRLKSEQDNKTLLAIMYATFLSMVLLLTDVVKTKLAISWVGWSAVGLTAILATLFCMEFIKQIKIDKLIDLTLKDIRELEKERVKLVLGMKVWTEK